MHTALSLIDRYLTHPMSPAAIGEPSNGGLAAMFLKSAARNPDAPALTIGGDSYTFAQLRETARRWARRLWDLREERPGRVGIFAGRGETACLGMLAAAVSGAAAVPLNPKLPTRRITAMADQAELDAIIVDGAALPRLQSALDRAAYPPPLLLWDARRCESDWVVAFDADDLGLAPMIRDIPNAAAGDTAYVLFNSSTTGVSSGVAISNAEVCSCLAHRRRYRIDERIAETFDNPFSPPILDMFRAWSAGAAVRCAAVAAE